MSTNELWALDPTDRITSNINLYVDESTEQQAKIIQKALQDDIFYVRLRQQVWKMIQEDSLEDRQIASKIRNVLESSNSAEIVATMAAKAYKRIHATRMQKTRFFSDVPLPKPVPSSNPSSASSASPLAHPRTSKDECVDHIRDVRVQWENGILEELKAISFESKRPFLLTREKGAKNPLIDGGSAQSNNSASNNNNGSTTNNTTSASNAGEGEKEEAVKFLFDSEDLMETVLGVKNRNLKDSALNRQVGLMQVSFSSLTLAEVADRYAELSSAYSQIGVDDIQTTGAGGLGGTRFLLQRQEEAEAALAAGSMLQARSFLRRGCPPSLRARIWRLACGLPERSLNLEEQSFLRLRGEVDRLDLLTDELFLFDLQTVLDDPRFFVFEEELKEVVLCFTRDHSVFTTATYQIHAPLLREMGADYPNDYPAPPCGVFPHLGFCTYFAPPCYVFKHKPSLFLVCRALYCEIWCKLNVVASGRDTLLGLCASFESLLMEAQPRLFLHLVGLGLQPLKVAFPWMQLAFIGLLEIDQLLHLWERVLGFGDPLLLSVAAAGVFVYRAEMLLRCSSEAEAVAVLMEGSRLHIVPILQAMILRDARG
eukprot:gene26974-32589_t